MGKTTVKAINLKYGTVGASTTTALMGVLKGLTIGQDEPDSTEIEAEFYDSPFESWLTMNFPSFLPCSVEAFQETTTRLLQMHTQASILGKSNLDVDTKHCTSIAALPSEL